MMNYFARLLRIVCLLGLLTGVAARSAESARQTIARATLTEDAAQKRGLITLLMGQGDEAIAPLLEAWRTTARPSISSARCSAA